MAQACVEILSLSAVARAALSRSARQRMEQNFDIQVIARQYHDIWREVLGSGQRSAVRLQPEEHQAQRAA